MKTTQNAKQPVGSIRTFKQYSKHAEIQLCWLFEKDPNFIAGYIPPGK